MCDLICDVITLAVLSTHLIKSDLKTRNKKENMEIKDSFT